MPSVSKFDLTKRYCIVSFLFEQINVVHDGDVDLPQRIRDNLMHNTAVNVGLYSL